MGAFGIILLVLFICFLLYFFGGMIVLKLRGATGLEIIPNHMFWLTLPLKIKVKSTGFKIKSAFFYFQAAFLFLINGCKTQAEGYEEI